MKLSKNSWYDISVSITGNSSKSLVSKPDTKSTALEVESSTVLDSDSMTPGKKIIRNLYNSHFIHYS
jgi:hypothetical protein